MQVLFMGRLHTQPTDAILKLVKAEAETIAADLPLVQAGFLEVQLLPLKPYTGLASLFRN